jgi:hypothetical protein
MRSCPNRIWSAGRMRPISIPTKKIFSRPEPGSRISSFYPGKFVIPKRVCKVDVIAEAKAVPESGTWSLDGAEEFNQRGEADSSLTLVDTFLTIQERRGALYMLDMARYLLEKWDLHSDRLQEQSDEARDLVAKLLSDDR